MNILGYSSPPRRTLGSRERELLWEKARHKCEACGKRVTVTAMQAGHKTAASRGGRATLRNSVCLCYDCNRKMGTMSYPKYMALRYGKKNVKTATSSKRRKATTKRRSRRRGSDPFGLGSFRY
jgi:5-methylcytosine-specific restriction endonuclease McrA